jgi:hypothetical protein
MKNEEFKMRGVELGECLGRGCLRTAKTHPYRVAPNIECPTINPQLSTLNFELWLMA